MKLFIFIITFFLYAIGSLADEEHYLCKLDTKFYETDRNEWSQKIIDYDLYISNKSEIKILDRQTNRYLNSFEIIQNNDQALVGYFFSNRMINIFTFNKTTQYAKYSNMYFDEQGGGQIGVGKCYTKTI
ncbi:MAG: hypothetical protein VW204_04735 [Pelagibacteraceae bacterium]|jgi:hypothetical protein